MTTEQPSPPDSASGPSSDSGAQKKRPSQVRAAAVPSLPLSARERTVSILFADDHSADEIGLALGLSVETVRSSLTQVRRKYLNANRNASDRLRLRACLVEDGLLTD